MIKSPSGQILCLLVGAGLSACAVPKQGGWPTVSFGHEIEAMEAAYAQPSEVQLAPLPALTDADRAGLSEPVSYTAAIEAEFAKISEKISARRQDYDQALSAMPGASKGAFHNAWLNAQMELSNISQNTEELARLRAKVSALGEPLPEGAKILLQRIEGLELQNRLMLRKERLKLSDLEPS